MNDFTLKAVVTPEVIIKDPLSELLRVGARGLIAQAVEAELAMMLMKHEDNKLPDGRPARWSRYLVIDLIHPWIKSTRQRAKFLAATVLRPSTFALNEQSVCLPQ